MSKAKLGYRFHVFLDVIQSNALGRNLQQNGAALLSEREGRNQNHDADEDADCRVDIVPSMALRLPDDDRRDHDANVVDGIANDVNEHPQHAQVSVGFLGRSLAVVVLGVVKGRLSAVGMTSALFLGWVVVAMAAVAMIVGVPVPIPVAMPMVVVMIYNRC